MLATLFTNMTTEKIFAIGVIVVAILAVLFIGLNLLLHDGSAANSEINFLELAVGGLTGGGVLSHLINSVINKKNGNTP